MFVFLYSMSTWHILDSPYKRKLNLCRCRFIKRNTKEKQRYLALLYTLKIRMSFVKRTISDPFDSLNATLIRILKLYLKP